MREFILNFFGAIFISTTLSAQWVAQNSGTSSLLNNVFFPTNDTGYALKSDGGILKTTDGGSNWALISNANTASDFYFISADTGIAVKDDTISITIDGGANWLMKYSNSSLNNPIIHFVDKSTGYVICTNNSFDTCYTYKTIDSGENWILQGSFSGWLIFLNDVFFTTSDTGYLSLGYGEIYKTVDSGQNWSLVFIDSTGNTQINSIHFPSSNIGYVAGIKMGIGAVVYKTIDSGINWLLLNTQQPGPLYSVFFTGNNTGYAVGGNGLGSGTVIKTEDGGNTWALATSQTATFYSVFFANSNIGYAVGTNGTILKYTDTTTVSMGANNFTAYNKSSIFPNPSTMGIFSVSEIWKGGSIIVTDMLGQTVYKQSTSPGNRLIDISAYPRGIYLAKMQNGEEVFVFKLIFH